MVDLRCGDSYSLIKDVPDNSVDLVIIDPPYVQHLNNDNKSKFFIQKGIHHFDNVAEVSTDRVIDMIDLRQADAYEEIKNIGDSSVDLVVIDPPYQFGSGGNGSSDIAQRKKNQKEDIYFLDTDLTKEMLSKEDEMSPQRKAYFEYLAEHGKDGESERLRVIANSVDTGKNTYFISKGIENSILEELCRVMKKINIYIWCSKAQLRQLFDFFDDRGCNLDLLTWHKTNPIPTCNGTYLSDTEYLVFAREGGVKLYGSYETKMKYYVTPINVDDKKLWQHPTIKPLKIIENLIINSSKENDVVLDCFMGSGTTGVACKELNRDFIGIELNPKYFEIARRRIGETSVKETSSEENEEAYFEKVSLI